MFRRFCMHHPLGAFFALAFGISWLLWLPLVASSRGMLPFRVPFGPFWFLGGWGPTLASLILTIVQWGLPWLWAFFRRAPAWRRRPRWYAAALLTPALLSLGAIGLRVLLGGAVPAPLPAVPWYLVPLTFVTSLPTGPLSEEFGWRGYALPRMQARQGPLWAALTLGLLWGTWHLPLFLIQGMNQAGGSFFWFVVHGVALSVLFSWVYNQSGGSLLLAILLHAAINTTFAVIPIVPSLTGDPVPYLLYIGLTWVLAVAIVALGGLIRAGAATAARS